MCEYAAATCLPCCLLVPESCFISSGRIGLLAVFSNCERPSNPTKQQHTFHTQTGHATKINPAAQQPLTPILDSINIGTLALAHFSTASTRSALTAPPNPGETQSRPSVTAASFTLSLTVTIRPPNPPSSTLNSLLVSSSQPYHLFPPASTPSSRTTPILGSSNLTSSFRQITTPNFSLNSVYTVIAVTLLFRTLQHKVPNAFHTFNHLASVRPPRACHPRVNSHAIL